MGAHKIVRVRLNDHWRARIKTGLLIKRLQDHALSETELMTASQIKATEVLLRKIAPDLTAVGGDPNGTPIKAEVKVHFVKP